MSNIISLNREQLLLFKKNSENRLINHSHKNRIKKQMEKFLDYFTPITVNIRTSNIIDGQHRWIAFIELVEENKLPIESTLDVKYLDIPIEKEKEAIVEANINNKNWTIDDYIYSYSKSNENYVKLIDWCSTHMLCIDGKKHKYRCGAAFLTKKRCDKELKDGSFTIDQENMNSADTIHDELVDILEILDKKSTHFLESLIISWIEVRHLHPYNIWRKEIKTKKNMILKKSTENQKDWNDIFGLVLRGIEIKIKSI